MKEPKPLSPLPRAGEGAPQGRVRELSSEEGARVADGVPSPGAEAPPSPACGRGHGEHSLRSDSAVDEDTLRERARGMRSDPTDAESRLWYRLRDRRFFGLKFKRQKPVGSYIVDFICDELKLVVELDGGQHASTQKAYDTARDAYLRAQGWSVLRFWNDELLKEPDAVLERIRQFAQAS